MSVAPMLASSFERNEGWGFSDRLHAGVGNFLPMDTGRHVYPLGADIAISGHTIRPGPV